MSHTGDAVVSAGLLVRGQRLIETRPISWFHAAKLSTITYGLYGPQPLLLVAEVAYKCAGSKPSENLKGTGRD